MIRGGRKERGVGAIMIFLSVEKTISKQDKKGECKSWAYK